MSNVNLQHPRKTYKKAFSISILLLGVHLKVWLNVWLNVWIFSSTILMASDQQHKDSPSPATDSTWLLQSHVPATTSVLALTAGIVTLNKPLLNSMPAIFKGVNSHLSYAFALFAATGYILQKKSTLSSSVWLSATENHEPFINSSNAKGLENLESSSKQDPNMIPTLASNTQSMEEEARTNPLTPFQSPEERLSLATSVGLMSLRPLVSNVIQDYAITMDSIDHKLHEKFFNALVQIYVRSKNLEISLYGLKTIHQNIPKDVGLIYHSPHTLALVEAYGALFVLLKNLALTHNFRQEYLSAWQEASYLEKFNFLAMDYDGQNPEIFHSATHILKSSIQINHLVLQSVLRVLDGLHSSEEDEEEALKQMKNRMKDNKTHNSINTKLAQAIPSTGSIHWKPLILEHILVEDFRKNILNKLSQNHSLLNLDIEDTEDTGDAGAENSPHHNSSSEHNVTDRLDVVLKALLLSGMDSSLLKKQLQMVIDLEGDRIELYLKSYSQLRYIKYSVLDLEPNINAHRK